MHNKLITDTTLYAASSSGARKQTASGPCFLANRDSLAAAEMGNSNSPPTMMLSFLLAAAPPLLPLTMMMMAMLAEAKLVG